MRTAPKQASLSTMSLPFLSSFLILSFIHSLPLQTQTAFVSPVSKDQTTLSYTLFIYLKTPLQPTKLLLHLGSSFTWLDCSTHYTSSSYQPIPCNSSLCNSFHSLACSHCVHSPGPSCSPNSCSLFPVNPITLKATSSNAITDSLALLTTDGSVPGRLALFSDFVFSCAPAFLLHGLAEGVVGLAALGRSNYSLPAQVSNASSSLRYFALCLSGHSDPGVALFGTSGPYDLLPGFDLSKSLVYTPLVLNPVGNTVITYAGQPSDEYFIGLTALKVNGRAVQLNDSLLTVDQNGFGGTKISTVNPYTVLEASIYKAFTESFVNESAGLNLTVTNAVKPFSVCYPAADLISTRVGPAVPTVDLVMQNDEVFWRIFGANSMVRITEEGVDVWCLAYVDGGVNARTSLVIGGHQMEDNLLQFDLETYRLGFTSSILVQGKTCANFNFTTNDHF